MHLQFLKIQKDLTKRKIRFFRHKEMFIIDSIKQKIKIFFNKIKTLDQKKTQCLFILNNKITVNNQMRLLLDLK